MSLHVYTAPMQPATNFVDATDSTTRRFRCSPFALRRCYGCRKARRAKNLKVQVFYDSIRYWCKECCNA